MRIDYLAPATGEELVAEAELVRNGDGVAAVEADVTDGEGTTVARPAVRTRPAARRAEPGGRAT